jgi:hypothetical protein
MYVIVESKGGHIYGFGLTRKRAMNNFLDGLLSYDGPPLDTRLCSPALYRQLQALDRKGLPLVDCRINRQGVAVCRKDMPRAITRRRD